MTGSPKYLALRAGAFALIVGCVSAVVQAPSAAAAGASLTIAPATLGLAPGASGALDVVLNTDVPSRGIQFGLKYDPTVVTIDKVSDGTLYQSWAKTQGVQASTLIQFRADNSKGRVSIGGIAVLGGAGKGVTGSGPVIHLALTAPAGANGQTTLELTDVSVSDAGVNAVHPIPGVTTVGATIAVGAGVDAGSLQAPSAAAASAAQAPPEPVFGIGTGGLVQGVVTPTPVAAAPAAPSTGRVDPPAAVPTQPAMQPQQAPAGAQQPAAGQQLPVVTDQQGGTPAQAIAPAAVQQPSAAGGQQQVAPIAQQTAPEVAGQSATPPGVVPTQPAATTGQVGPVGAAPPTGVVPAGNSGQAQGAPGTIPAVGAAAPAGGAQSLAQRPLATPTRSAVAAAAPVSVPRASTGLLIPYEVLAGLGGGIVAGGLVLYAMRTRERESVE